MKILFSLLIIVPIASIAQKIEHKNDLINRGVHFEKQLTWQQILDKAKEEKKYIFVDCFASWCDPCRKMDVDVYPSDSVGFFMNAHFVCIKEQMDTSRNDDAEVKARYADADFIRTVYQVNVYPTFLFLAPGGKIVHRGIGYLEPSDFIALAKRASDPATQYYTLLAAYRSGKSNYSTLPYLALSAEKFEDLKLADSIAGDYFHNYLDKLSPIKICTQVNLKFVDNFVHVLTSKDKIFYCFLNYPALVDSCQHFPGLATKFITIVAKNEEVTPAIAAAKKKGTEPNWRIMGLRIRHKFGSVYVDKNIIPAKVEWYKASRDWPQYAKYLVKRIDLLDLKELPNSVNNMLYLNNRAWEIFEYSNDREALKKAIIWTDRALEMTPKGTEGGGLDTKANLLYKLGYKEEALRLERVASKTASENVKALVQTNLQKMERGDPTWPIL